MSDEEMKLLSESITTDAKLLEMVNSNLTALVSMDSIRRQIQRAEMTRDQILHEARTKRRNVYRLPENEGSFLDEDNVYDATTKLINYSTLRKISQQSMSYADARTTNEAARSLAISGDTSIASGQLRNYLSHVLNESPFTGIKFLRSLTGSRNFFDPKSIKPSYLCSVAKLTTTMFRNPLIGIRTNNQATTSDEMNMEDVVGILMLYEDISLARGSEANLTIIDGKISPDDALCWLNKIYDVPKETPEYDGALVNIDRKKEHVQKAVNGLVRLIKKSPTMKMIFEDKWDDDDDDVSDNEREDEDEVDESFEIIPWKYWSDDLVYDGEEESISDRSLWQYDYVAKINHPKGVPVSTIPMIEIQSHLSDATDRNMYDERIWLAAKNSILRFTWDDTTHRLLTLTIGCLVAILYSLYRNGERKKQTREEIRLHAETLLVDTLTNANLYDRNIGDLFPGFIIYILEKWTFRKDCFNLQRAVINKYNRQMGVSDKSGIRSYEDTVGLRKYMEIGLNNMSNPIRKKPTDLMRLPDYYEDYIYKLVYPVVLNVADMPEVQ